MHNVSRRSFVGASTAIFANCAPGPLGKMFHFSGSAPFPDARPPLFARKFRSPVVEQFIADISKRISDPELATIFRNCFPNTLDTTVQQGTFDGKPDTVVITGDIDAMWLRDSSAQVWPYLPFTARDERLRALIEGLIRRQTRCILIDPYANAFMADLATTAPLVWAVHDDTVMHPGVGERKWELDSLCYPIRLAHEYWKRTGDTSPFDANWHQSLRLTVKTLREQQRKHDDGPYRYRSESVLEGADNKNGYGPSIRPVGLIASRFRPSDDPCVYQFLIPSNLFAVTALGSLSEMAHRVLHDDALANDAHTLAQEVEDALKKFGTASSEGGTIWAYEVDGSGHQLLMDDSNVPSLLALPYLKSSPDAALYKRTRAFVWSAKNPWFFRGTAGEGIGGPHIGKDMIWPMSQIMYAQTSTSDQEIRKCIRMLKISAVGTGLMHESYNKNDPSNFTRSWFAWANTLFGELVATLALRDKALLDT